MKKAYTKKIIDFLTLIVTKVLSKHNKTNQVEMKKIRIYKYMVLVTP